MNFFVKLKSYFNKNISILPYQKTDMVSFVKLRNNSIKINSSVEVEDNYNFVLVYFNKVCDIISSGSFKLNEDNIPKLFRFSKIPLGLSALTTTSIVCDAYYVNLNTFENNHFKTQDKITALSEGQKIKIKLNGTFNMKVCDTLKFMKALCNDYAVIKNKKAIKEICSTVGFEVSKVLNSKNFSVDDYIFNKDKIVTTLEELVNNHTKTFGVEVNKFNINEIIVNKKYLNEVQLAAIEQIENSSKFVEPEIEKIAEVGINNLNEKYEVVYAGKNEKLKKENNNIDRGECSNKNLNFDSNKIQENFNQNLKDENKKTTEYTAKNNNINFNKINENNKNDIFIKDLEVSANKILDNTTQNYNSIKTYGNSLNTENKTSSKFSNVSFDLSQPEPQIIGFENENALMKIKKIKTKTKKNEVLETKQTIEKKENNERIKIDNSLKEVNSKKRISNFKICACCGSKNFGDEKLCNVCKSMLD